MFFVISFSYLNAYKIGSEKAVSTKGHVLFYQNQNDNEMNGFAAFLNGFTLQNSNVTCTFNSYFSVAGKMRLNGGTLFLQKDLFLGEDVELESMGNLCGNGHKIEFSSGVSCLSAVSTDIVPSLKFLCIDKRTDYKFDTAIRSLDWSYDDQYVVAIGKDPVVVVYSFDGTDFTLVNYEKFEKEPYSVSAHPSGYYFAVGAKCAGEFDELMVYKLNEGKLSLITSYNAGATGSVSWSPNGNFIAAGCSKRLKMYQFSEEVITQRTTSYLGRDTVRNAIAWDPTSSYIGIAADSYIFIHHYSDPIATEKIEFDVGDSIFALDWSKTGNYIAIGCKGEKEQIRVYSYDSDSNILTEKCTVDTRGLILSVNWSSDGRQLVVGSEQIKSDIQHGEPASPYKGLSDLFRVVDIGEPPFVEEYGRELQIYDFDEASELLTLRKDEEFSTDINSVRWSHDDSYILTGDAAHNVCVYKYSWIDKGTNENIPIVFDNLSLSLKNDLSWKMATTIQGNCVIDGNGKKITLEDCGKIVVDANSSLLLRNITLQGMSNNYLCCFDGTSILSLQDVNWYQDCDFSFTTGSLQVLGDWVLRGTHVFSYQSAQTSTIHSEARIVLDKGITFSYAPSIASRDLIAMEDVTSVLRLNGATLYATSTGLRLTNGTLQIKGDVDFHSEVVSTTTTTSKIDGGISFGDGVSANDCVCEIFDGSKLNVKHGSLHYCNVAQDSFVSKSRLSAIEVSSFAALKLYENLNLGVGELYLQPRSSLLHADGMRHYGATYLLGNVNYGLIEVEEPGWLPE